MAATVFGPRFARRSTTSSEASSPVRSEHSCCASLNRWVNGRMALLIAAVEQSGWGAPAITGAATTFAGGAVSPVGPGTVKLMLLLPPLPASSMAVTVTVCLPGLQAPSGGVADAQFHNEGPVQAIALEERPSTDALTLAIP